MVISTYIKFLISGGNIVRRTHEDRFNQIEICSHIDMKTADNKLVIGWLASQTDMFAEDWKVVE